MWCLPIPPLHFPILPLDPIYSSPPTYSLLLLLTLSLVDAVIHHANTSETYRKREGDQIENRKRQTDTAYDWGSKERDERWGGDTSSISLLPYDWKIDLILSLLLGNLTTASDKCWSDMSRCWSPLIRSHDRQFSHRASLITLTEREREGGVMFSSVTSMAQGCVYPAH